MLLAGHVYTMSHTLILMNFTYFYLFLYYGDGYYSQGDE